MSQIFLKKNLEKNKATQINKLIKLIISIIVFYNSNLFSFHVNICSIVLRQYSTRYVL